MHSLRVASYILFGQKEDSSLEGSISDSSERLLQSGSGGRSIYKVLVKGEFNSVRYLEQEKGVKNGGG